jgi:transcriptional regulator with XRE-family HTH domain
MDADQVLPVSFDSIYDPCMIYVEQIRAARALLGWNQDQLAHAAGIGIATLKRMEQGSGPVGGNARSAWKIEQALEGAGIELVPPTQAHGLGVRLAKPG